jgi:predicted dehydrogenase
VGIVGCGRILPAHLNGYKVLLERDFDEFEITAICARKVEDARRFVSPAGPPPRPPVSSDADDPLNAPHVYVSDLFPDSDVSVWTDASLMIEEADLDVIDITASVFAHHPIAIQAFSKGKHVMVQKPMAVSVGAARQMVAAAENAGTALGVMEDVHYQPSVLMGRWLVSNGYLGRIQMAVATYLANPHWSPDRIVADTAWRHRSEQAGAGISLDLGVHFFQHFRRVCGPIARVYGSVRTFEPVRYRRSLSGSVIEEVEVDVDDTMFAQIEFREGGVGHLSASWAGRGVPTELPGGIVIYGSKGCLQGDKLYLDGHPPTHLTTFFEEHATDRERHALFPRGIRDPFAQAYLDFFGAIREGRKSSYDGGEGMMDLALGVAVTESSQTRRYCTPEEVIAQADSEGGLRSAQGRHDCLALGDSCREPG